MGDLHSAVTQSRCVSEVTKNKVQPYRQHQQGKMEKIILREGRWEENSLRDRIKSIMKGWGFLVMDKLKHEEYNFQRKKRKKEREKRKKA